MCTRILDWLYFCRILQFGEEEEEEKANSIKRSFFLSATLKASIGSSVYYVLRVACFFCHRHLGGTASSSQRQPSLRQPAPLASPAQPSQVRRRTRAQSDADSFRSSVSAASSSAGASAASAVLARHRSLHNGAAHSVQPRTRLGAMRSLDEEAEGRADIVREPRTMR